MALAASTKARYTVAPTGDGYFYVLDAGQPVDMFADEAMAREDAQARALADKLAYGR
jgi:hypothetical protein